MSDLINDEYIEEATFYAEYFTGTLLGRLLVQDMERNDLEELEYHLKEARDLSFQMEYGKQV